MSLRVDLKRHLTRWSHNHLAVALVLTLLLIIWLISGTFFRAQTEEPEAPPKTEQETAYRVETRKLSAEQHTPVQIVQGQLEPLRAVEIRSQINAHLTERIAQWGASVDQAGILFRLDPATKAAELARAEADLALKNAELAGGEKLFKKNLLAETDYLRLKSAVASARAEYELQALQLQYAQVRAPFAGVIDRLPVEEGDYIQAGDPLATLVDISGLRLIAFIPQQHIYALKPGLKIEASLLDGTKLPGILTFVASLAQESTRSFRVEAHLENLDLKRIAGSSATMTIYLPEQTAHRLSPSLLVLGDDGQIVIKTVDAEQRVKHQPLKILSFDPAGVWVEGLPDEVEIITLGAGFVSEGDRVNPVSAESL